MPEGKELWVDQWLTPQPVEVIMSPAREKHIYATTNGVSNILIDDKSSTVDSWNNAGGIGVLHIPGGSAQTVQILGKIA